MSLMSRDASGILKEALALPAEVRAAFADSFYREKATALIQIVAVAHGKRRPGYWLERTE